MSSLNSLGIVFYDKELAGISKALNGKISTGLLVAMQLIYEVSACCTSIIVPGKDQELSGAPLHIRTMDWGMDFLKPLTIEVDFMKNNKCVYTATTWAGYVGVLTGCRHKAWSASVNFRVTKEGTIWDNLKRALDRSWPIGFLLREALTRTSDFDEATRILAGTQIISPVYFTVCGVKVYFFFLV